MSYQQLVSTMTPELRDSLAHAVAIGRWPDGRALSNEQKEIVIQALIAWQALNEPERDEPFTVNANAELRIKSRDKSDGHKHDSVETSDEFLLDLK